MKKTEDVMSHRLPAVLHLLFPFSGHHFFKIINNTGSCLQFSPLSSFFLNGCIWKYLDDTDYAKGSDANCILLKQKK
jgi:hypothetical protein